MPMVLFGTEYWRQIVDFDALARHGVINPEDIAIYRALAGGVTTANILHGSANSISMISVRRHSNDHSLIECASDEKWLLSTFRGRRA